MEALGTKLRSQGKNSLTFPYTLFYTPFYNQKRHLFGMHRQASSILLLNCLRNHLKAIKKSFCYARIGTPHLYYYLIAYVIT